MKRVVLSVFLLLSAVAARPVTAAPIIGQQLFAAGGDVTAVFLGHTAGFTNDLYLFAASDLLTPLPVTAVVGTLGQGVIFTNQTSPILAPVNLGFFAAGTELVFGIHVQDTGYTYYLGPASRNPDGLFHGAVDSGMLPAYPFGWSSPGYIGVGFEDIFGGGDLDYDDLGFAFTNVRREVTPEPATLALLALGAGAVGARRLRRRA
jgi:hypothetical protein